MENNNTLPDGIFRLEYNEYQRCFHYSNNLENKNNNGWYFLKVMSESECHDFTTFMDKKYNDGRVTGILPELKIVKLELELYFELKKSKLKLAGR